MESSHFIFFLNQKLDLNCYILTVMKFKSTHLKYKNLSGTIYFLKLIMICSGHLLTVLVYSYIKCPYATKKTVTVIILLHFSLLFFLGNVSEVML